jgi:hypothetical protein
VTIGTTKESFLLISDTKGRELIRPKTADLKTVIDISKLPCGVYFVRVTNDKTVVTGKVVKQ